MAFFAVSCLNAMGVVYGDIGTSVLYVFKSIFEEKAPDPTEVKGATCLILYSITFVVCVKYLIFVLMADYRGEGGIFALVSLLLHDKTGANQFTRNRDLEPSRKSKANSETAEKQVEMQEDAKRFEQLYMSIDLEDEQHEHAHTTSNSISKLKFSKFLTQPKVKRVYRNLSLIGAGLLLGDGVITPSISVLSAVEGLELLGSNVTPAVVPLTCIILVFLFVLQRFGTAKVGLLFGPIMLIWFASITGIGIYHITSYPQVFEVFNPWYGYNFFATKGKEGWVLMGSVVLCVTGCEAMYADMGHFGKNSVRVSWLFIVYPSLLLNYLGQSAMLIVDPSTIDNPFFRSVPNGLFFPMLILSTLATIIASQALISGAFSITEQAMSLGTFPRMKVIHTSDKVEGQIYIPTLNYMLMIVCIILVISFKTSTALSYAYGLAVCGDMTLTTVMYCSIARLRWKWHLAPWIVLLVSFLIVDGVFLSSTLLKIPYGGYVPLIIALVVSGIMYTWREGRQSLQEKVKTDHWPFSLLQDRLQDRSINRYHGTSIFLTAISDGVPPSLAKLMEHVPYIHDTAVFLTIKYEHVPYVKKEKHIKLITLPEPGFYRVIARYGYRESKVSMEHLLKDMAEYIPELDIEIKDVSFFLNVENVRIDKSRWLGHRLWIKLFHFLHHVCL